MRARMRRRQTETIDNSRNGTTGNDARRALVRRSEGNCSEILGSERATLSGAGSQHATARIARGGAPAASIELCPACR